MRAVLDALAANPTAAAMVFGSASSLTDASRRGTVALLGKAAGLAGAAMGAARRPRYRRRLRSLTTSAGVPVPWREPGYGVARALSAAEFAAGNARLTAAFARTDKGER